jgi:glucosamine-6-phosphate deaminase
LHITTFATRDDVAVAAARRVADALRDRPNLVLGLPAGQTPVPVYAELRRLASSGAVDFAAASSFALDEFVGLERTDPRSFAYFIHEHLIAGTNFDPRHVHFLDGSSADIDEECNRYEAAIAAAGGIDLQILGLGRNGHIGFNEPADALHAHTHRVVLRQDTRSDNAGRFGRNADHVPREAISMGVGTILHARAIVVIATGASKAAAVERMVRGPVTTQLPASLLQLHASVDVYLDHAAAARL